MTVRTDRKEAALRLKLDEREFADEDVTEFLAGMDIDTLTSKLGEPQQSTQYATAHGWRVGDGRPSLGNEDPAVMQAVARCASSRVRREKFAEVSRVIDNVHPTTCDWCDYPLDELLKACAWN